jgi:hypothetical protein
MRRKGEEKYWLRHLGITHTNKLSSYMLEGDWRDGRFIPEMQPCLRTTLRPPTHLVEISMCENEMLSLIKGNKLQNREQEGGVR